MRISLLSSLIHFSYYELIIFAFLFIEIVEFQSIVGNFIGMVDGLAKEVENEKMKVLNYLNFTERNELKI